VKLPGWIAPVLVCLSVPAIAAGVVLAFGSGSAGQSARATVPVVSQPLTPTSTAPPQASHQPNIVFVLTDDLSLNLLRFMPHVQAMQRQGLTFENYFVSDSLCCPSRASIFTGNFPHTTQVFSNFGPDGGFRTFYQRGEEAQTFAVALQSSGYSTALMGKYLNGYLDLPGNARDGATIAVGAHYAPPGWSEWDVAGVGYPEFDYVLNHNRALEYFGHQPEDYLTDVVSRRGTAFINRAAQSHKPFFLELSTFAPHSPYVPAPRDAHDFPGLKAPHPPSFDVLPTDAPRWLADHPSLKRRQLRVINAAFRHRAQSVQAVDRMIGSIEATLQSGGLASNTYILFSSDNGLHTGEYRLMPGKLTAFDTDIHVPLIVTGPGVHPGQTTAAMAENVDLASTFAAIAGTALPSDGHSLLPLLRGQQPADWRNAVLIEHHGPRISLSDPDFQQSASGTPTTYEAMRTQTFLYVEYADGEHEFYDLRTDPFELHNIASSLSPETKAQLHAELMAMQHCHGDQACWTSMRVGPAAR
jgi:N-acetylglucosamine-6-sulfatase